VPPGLDDPARVLIGVDHYAAHCAVCHGAPGVPKGDIGLGLHPPPPDLAQATSLCSPAELFWVLKHRIKMTGMPAWGDQSDEELWATVAFLEKLPGMSEQDYAKLLIASAAHGAHHHPGTGDRNPPQLDPPKCERDGSCQILSLSDALKRTSSRSLTNNDDKLSRDLILIRKVQKQEV
jgi:hypothetical protein